MDSSKAVLAPIMLLQLITLYAQLRLLSFTFVSQILQFFHHPLVLCSALSAPAERFIVARNLPHQYHVLHWL